MGPARWWLSFCDASKPPGSQFLGVAIVHGDDLVTAITRAHAIGANPGGDVEGIPLPIVPPHVDAKWMDRLLTREEVNELEAEMAQRVLVRDLMPNVTTRSSPIRYDRITGFELPRRRRSQLVFRVRRLFRRFPWRIVRVDRDDDR